MAERRDSTYRPLQPGRRGYGPNKKKGELVKVHTEHASFNRIKGMLALGFVFLQLIIILAISVFLSAWLVWYLVLCLVVSIITAVYCISSDRSVGTKAIWVFFVLVFFIIGFIVYWLSDDRVVYRRARRRHERIFERSNAYLGEYNPPENLTEPVLSDCRYLYNAGKALPHRDSAVKYYSSGGPFFDDVLEDLKGARSFIFIEFFIISDGALFSRFWDVLEEKVREGVDVRVMYDDMGTRKELSRPTIDRMKNSGVDIRVFNKLIARFSFAMNLRDHRKIVVADGKVAYTGGFNLSDEYINERPMYGYWKDSGVRVTGEAMDTLTMTFLRQWEYVTKQQVEYDRYLRHYDDSIRNDYVITPYCGGPDYERPVCRGIYENIIAGAREKLYIFTPYFVPDEPVIESLANKALSGVDVRLIIPEIPDKSYVFVLTEYCAERLTESGVKVYELRDSFVHSKSVLTENCVVVGSTNFDMRSFYQQFENGIYSNDPSFMKAVEDDYDRVMSGSVEIKGVKRHNIFYRMWRGILRIVQPLM